MPILQAVRKITLVKDGMAAVNSVLKSSPVWSFTPILRQPDRNWSFDFPDLRQPDRDRSRPVHVGPHSGPNQLQLVFTKTGPRLVHNQFKVIFMNINVN